jgi:hypothetical protein
MANGGSVTAVGEITTGNSRVSNSGGALDETCGDNFAISLFDIVV